MRAAVDLARAALTKTCTKCEATLPAGDFHRDRSRRDGLFTWCKACIRANRVRNASPKPPPAATPSSKACTVAARFRRWTATRG